MKTARLPLLLALSLTALACQEAEEAPVFEAKGARVSRAWESSRDPALAGGGRAAIHFTRPGSARGEGEVFAGEAAVVEALNAARYSLDVCLYEFNRAPFIDALLAAITRGVSVRFVGDGDELIDEGYHRLEGAGLALSLRPAGDRIMHNKFIVIDHRAVLTGSMNFSDNGVERNNNHLIHLQDEAIAALYAEEFEQLYAGDFGRDKARLSAARGAATGEGRVEVYFAPADDPIEIVRRELSRARARVFFMVFSFSHTDLRADLLRMHRAGVQIVGLFDESQAEQGYSADDTLAEAGVPVYIDGNDNRSGFAGGKLHHKVMIIDGGEAEPVVIAGSFNWSNAATRYNDENLLVLRGRAYATPFLDEFCALMEEAVLHPSFSGREPTPCDDWVQPARINEILALPDPDDPEGAFVELINAGHRPLDLDGWIIATRLGAPKTLRGVTLPPGGAYVARGLRLDAEADEVALSDPWGRLIDRVTLRQARLGVSFNRVDEGGRAGPFEAHPALEGRFSSPGRQRSGAPWLAHATARLLINEIMPNPEGDDTGGEFVELLNVSDAPLDLTGWRLGDSYEPTRHLFAEGVLLPGEVIVVFDSGVHRQIPSAINASSGRLNLGNAGDTVRLLDPSGALHDEAGYGLTRAGVSKNRAVDGQPASGLRDHDELAPAPSSPGLRVDLRGWDEPATAPKPIEPDDPDDPEGPVKPTDLEQLGPRVIINELLPNPAGDDLGQEFIELFNAGDAPADLSGWQLGDVTDPARHTFGATILAPGEALVVFDRGDHGLDNAHAALTGRLSLNNADDVVTLLDAEGALVDAAAYYSSQEGVSLNRRDDGRPDVPFVPHTDLSDLPSSPGVAADGAAF
ncbi:lamin tail domain-containing protein [Myxococcota bacterium]|nr:lamin tail domain-containing protein [Myxococcota bacterium]MBU1900532.1 lamin tail domain-containing protein [Myxococcota bacterium]